LPNITHFNNSGSKAVAKRKKTVEKQIVRAEIRTQNITKDLNYMAALEMDLRARGYTKTDLIRSLTEKHILDVLTSDLSPDQLAKTIGALVIWFKAVGKIEDGSMGTGEIDPDTYAVASRNILAHLENVISTDKETHKKVIDLIRASAAKSKTNVINIEPEHAKAQGE
jgi:hypothetical protein